MRALVTGVGGQDGFYLAGRLLAEGVEVHGVVREGAAPRGVQAHRLDLAVDDPAPLLARLRPDLVVNLAAISSVWRSWQQPELTAEVNGLAVARLLAATRELAEGGSPVRFLQASSAEIFGAATEAPQTERTRLEPTSPYGASKAYAHHLVGAYRRAGLSASALILYNHESARRPASFVSRKITSAAARIARGSRERLELGNLDARRDWGWAPDVADALLRAARAVEPDDYVVATGVTHSVREFAEAAFAHAGLDWRDHVDVSEALIRPGDAPEQVGDASHAREVLGWRPTMDFAGIVAAMVDADLAALD